MRLCRSDAREATLFDRPSSNRLFRKDLVLAGSSVTLLRRGPATLVREIAVREVSCVRPGRWW